MPNDKPIDISCIRLAVNLDFCFFQIVIILCMTVCLCANKVSAYSKPMMLNNDLNSGTNVGIVEKL